jgi:hypothetical protein
MTNTLFFGDLDGQLVLNLPAGQHTVKLQWKQFNKNDEVFGIYQSALDGFADHVAITSWNQAIIAFNDACASINVTAHKLPELFLLLSVNSTLFYCESYYESPATSAVSLVWNNAVELFTGLINSIKFSCR